MYLNLIVINIRKRNGVRLGINKFVPFCSEAKCPILIH